MFRRAAAVEVHEQGQGPGFASDVVVRGFTSDHSGDVLLVVDGVPVNLPINGHGEGYSDWNSLQSEAVSSLRLIHGPASPLYGDFALAGVVEVSTSADAEGTSMAVTGSSYGDVGGWLRTGRREDTGGSMLAVPGERSEGWRDNSQYWLVICCCGAGSARGQRVGSKAAWVSIAIGLELSRLRLGGRLQRRQAHAGNRPDRRRVGPAYRRPRPIRTALGNRTAFEATAWAFSSRWDLYLNIPETGEALQQTGEHDRRLATGAQSSVVWTPTAGEFTFGLAGRTDGADYQRDQTTSRVPDAAENDVDADYASASSFARYRRTFGTRLGRRRRPPGCAALRQPRLDGRRLIHEHTRTIVSPKAGVRYLLGENTPLLASLSHGFSGAPGVIQDLGRALRSRPGPARWGSTGTTTGPTSSSRRSGPTSPMSASSIPSRWRSPAPAPACVRGSTGGAGASLWCHLVDLRRYLDRIRHLHRRVRRCAPRGRSRGRAGSDRHSDSGPVRSGGRCAFPTMMREVRARKYPVSPRYTVQAGINTVLASKYLVALNARALGPYTRIGEPDLRTQPYIVFDLSGQVPLGAGLQLDVAIQNLFDTKYPEIRASGFINPGPPLTLRAAFNWSPSTP